MSVIAPTEVAIRLMESFNAGDWDAFRADVADDVVYVEAGTGRRIEGADAYLELCRAWRAALSDVRGTVRRSLEGGDVSALEVTWEGTHDGPLPTPSGDIPATGRRVSIEATLWTEVRDGLVIEVHHHLDVMALMAQIGALES
jgi:steroid delta-isomerase-like uncharacterized protein